MVAFAETSRPTHRAYAPKCVGSSSCAPGKNPSLGVDRNQQYSITALTNGSGGVVERYAYSACGVPVFLDASGTTLTSSAEDNRYTYTGREWDEELNLYHFRARIYDAVAGRFCSRDPKGYPDGANLYASYFYLSWRDPMGTDIIVSENDDEVIWYFDGACWKQVKDDCGKIIDAGIPVPCPCLPGTNTPWDELDWDTLVKLIETGHTGISIGQAIPGLPPADPTTTSPYMPLVTTVIYDAICAFPEFSRDESPCKDWYRQTAEALKKANSGDCSFCASISVPHPPSGNTAGAKCWETINGKGPSGQSLANQFSILTQSLASACRKLCQ